MSAFREARLVKGIVVEINTNMALPLATAFAELGWLDVSALSVNNRPVGVDDVQNGAAFVGPSAPSGPTQAQISRRAYSDLIAGGFAVTSTSTPALNGIYLIDADSQTNISFEAQFISTYSQFTNGAANGLQWQLLNGSWVTFPTTASFLAFAKAAGQTVAAAKLAAATSQPMPSATVTIA